MYSIIEVPPYISGFASWTGEFAELLKYSQIVRSDTSVPGASTISVP